MIELILPVKPQKRSILISLEHISFRYPDLPVGSRDTLTDINLQIMEGEYVAVVGANGSGKSTLARMINALLLPDTGQVYIQGLVTEKPRNIPHIRKNIGMVFQFPEEQIFSSTIEEDVAFGLENFVWDFDAMHRRVREVLEQFNLWDIRQRPSYLLSGGQTQRLALAGVLAIQPMCIIFDEATSMLDPLGRETVLKQMDELHQQGKTVLHITHSMDEASLASRIIVINQGKIVFDGSATELFSGGYPLDEWRLEYPSELRVIRRLSDLGCKLPQDIISFNSLCAYLKQNQGISDSNPPISDPQTGLPEVIVHQLGHIYLEGTPYQTRALLDVEMVVERGGFHGLIGITGSGKSTLLQHLNGLFRPQLGSVQIGPYQLVDKKVTLNQVVQYAGLVMQNPEAQFFEEFVGDEIAYGPRTLGIDEPLAVRVKWAMEMVGIDFDQFKDRRVYSLSGGEKRKVAIATILALKPKVLLMDEPTAGLDPKSHQEMVELFEALNSSGTTIVISSHNMEDIAHLTRTITVMERGHSEVNGSTRDVLCDSDQFAALNMRQPAVVRLTNQLRSAGLEIPTGILTEEELSRVLIGEAVR